MIPRDPETSTNLEPLSTVVDAHSSDALRDKVRTRWLEPKEHRRTLGSIFRAWARTPGHADLTDLAAIRHEVWAAQCGFQSPPDICVAWHTDEPRQILGLLAGYGRHAHRDYFIHNIAIHPLHRNNPSTQMTIAHALLEAAMDASIALGWYGWVTCSPEANDIRLWHDLGFTKEDDFTYRRMGYFH